VNTNEYKDVVKTLTSWFACRCRFAQDLPLDLPLPAWKPLVISDNATDNVHKPSHKQVF